MKRRDCVGKANNEMAPVRPDSFDLAVARMREGSYSHSGTVALWKDVPLEERKNGREGPER